MMTRMPVLLKQSASIPSESHAIGLVTGEVLRGADERQKAHEANDYYDDKNACFAKPERIELA
jgi:hypothetical protein